VVIVGAGPVGAASAILLAQRGVRCLLLDRYPTPYPLPRAVHVDDEVMRILQELGVADAFTAVSRPGPGLRLLDGRHRVMAEFRRSTAPGPHGWPQANMFDQPDLERLLRERIAQLPLIEFRGGVTVTGVTSTAVTSVSADRTSADRTSADRISADRTSATSTSVTLDDGTVVAASAVLGCDGANSTVRGLIGATLEDLGFEERWLVVDGVTDRDLDAWGGVHQICDPRRAATFMQLGPCRYRWEFRLRDGERPRGAAAWCSCSATRRTRPRRSSARGSARGCATRTTWAGSSPGSWRGAARPCWTRTNANANRTRSRRSGSPSWRAGR
jgi:3-(3-hydroxy-phenyl)propionate hydroxylase